jgi:hypothetical protein
VISIKFTEKPVYEPSASQVKEYAKSGEVSNRAGLAQNLDEVIQTLFNSAENNAKGKIYRI